MSAEDQYREALATIISEAQDDGLDNDLIISEMELQIMALKEPE